MTGAGGTISHGQQAATNPPLASTSTAKAKVPSMASAASGALSGIAIGALLQPLDVVRTRMQGDHAVGISRRSAVATATEILRTDGATSLWRGSAPAVLRMGLGVGLHMVLVESMSEALSSRPKDSGTQADRVSASSAGGGEPSGRKEHGTGGRGQAQARLTLVNAALVGGLARAVASTLLCPVTVIKTRMEYSGGNAVRYASTAEAFVTITRAEGLRGLFRGLMPTVLTTAPFSGLYYMFYTRLKEQLTVEGRPQFVVNFSAGAVAAVAATLGTQPFDVIRTRMQLTRATSGRDGTSVGYISTLRAALAQGPSTLFVGTLPRVLKRAGQTALVWTLYEEMLPRLSQVYRTATSAVLPLSNDGRR